MSQRQEHELWDAVDRYFTDQLVPPTMLCRRH